MATFVARLRFRSKMQFLLIQTHIDEQVPSRKKIPFLPMHRIVDLAPFHNKTL